MLPASAALAVAGVDARPTTPSSGLGSRFIDEVAAVPSVSTAAPSSRPSVVYGWIVRSVMSVRKTPTSSPGALVWTSRRAALYAMARPSGSRRSHASAMIGGPSASRRVRGLAIVPSIPPRVRHLRHGRGTSAGVYGSKATIFWRTPSSRIAKSAAARLLTGRPLLVAHDDVDDHAGGGGAESRSLRLVGRRRSGRLLGRKRQGTGEEKADGDAEEHEPDEPVVIGQAVAKGSIWHGTASHK